MKVSSIRSYHLWVKSARERLRMMLVANVKSSAEAQTHMTWSRGRVKDREPTVVRGRLNVAPG